MKTQLLALFLLFVVEEGLTGHPASWIEELTAVLPVSLEEGKASQSLSDLLVASLAAELPAWLMEELLPSMGLLLWLTLL